MKSIDIYGQQINLTYQGDESFKTIPGALTSVIIITIMLAYSAYRTYTLFARLNPNLSSPIFMQDLNEIDPFLPA